MKLRKYKILVCALSMGLVFTPNAVLAAGVEADEVILEEDMDGYWEAEEDADMTDDIWEDEDWEDDETEDAEDDIWEDEDWDDEEWEDEDWDTEDAFWDDEENALPVIECCDATADKAVETRENEPEGAEVTESQEENGMHYIAGAQGRNSYKVDDAESRDDAIAGIYTPIKKTQLHASAGAEETAFLEIDENTKIHCYGYYTEASGAKWYYVQYFQNGRSFIGFCSSEELK